MHPDHGLLTVPPDLWDYDPIPPDPFSLSDLYPWLQLFFWVFIAVYCIYLVLRLLHYLFIVPMVSFIQDQPQNRRVRVGCSNLYAFSRTNFISRLFDFKAHIQRCSRVNRFSAGRPCVASSSISGQVYRFGWVNQGYSSTVSCCLPCPFT